MNSNKNFKSLNILSHFPSYNIMKDIYKNDFHINLGSKNIQDNNQLIHFKIFEIEESINAKHKKKHEIKKQVININNNYNNKRKDDVLNKLSHNYKKVTIELNQNYIQVAEFNKQSLEKLKLDIIDNISPGYSENYGNLYYISKSYSNEFLNPFNPKILIKNKKICFFSNLNNNDDLNMKEIENFNVYCSDKVLASLMTMNLNSHPWHILINKKGNKLFFDIDEHSGIYHLNPEYDIIDDENCSINSYESLGIEASIINEYIKEVILDEKIDSTLLSDYKAFPFNNFNKSVSFDKFQTNESIETNSYISEKCVYCYKEWKLGDDIKILVRCQIHAGDLRLNEDNEEEIIKLNIFALNENNV